MGYFPAFIELSGRPVLVVGGGGVARRKVERVRGAGAVVTVVAPMISPSIAAMTDVTVQRRGYQAEDIVGKSLVFACTDDLAVQAAVAADARRAGVLVCTAHDGGAGDFLTGAILERGPVQVAVTTSGRSPVLAAWIRERLEESIGSHYGALADCMSTFRDRAGDGDAAEIARLSRALLEGGLESDLAAGREDLARAAIDQAVAAAIGGVSDAATGGTTGLGRENPTRVTE